MSLDFDFNYAPSSPAIVEAKERKLGRVTVTGDAEWYSPAYLVDRARKAMGGIDLDPASCEDANRVVKATSFYTEADNGLHKPWFGRIWLNPPYSATEILAFSQRLAHEYTEGKVSQACVLVSNSTETKWFAALSSVATAAVFLHSRVQFTSGRGRANRKPLQGYVVMYVGTRTDRFLDAFKGLGIEMLIVEPAQEQGLLG